MVADEHNPPARVVAAVKPEPDQAERRVQPRLAAERPPAPFEHGSHVVQLGLQRPVE